MLFLPEQELSQDSRAIGRRCLASTSSGIEFYDDSVVSFQHPFLFRRWGEFILLFSGLENQVGSVAVDVQKPLRCFRSGRFPIN